MSESKETGCTANKVNSALQIKKSSALSTKNILIKIYCRDVKWKEVRKKRLHFYCISMQRYRTQSNIYDEISENYWLLSLKSSTVDDLLGS